MLHYNMQTRIYFFCDWMWLGEVDSQLIVHHFCRYWLAAEGWVSGEVPCGRGQWTVNLPYRYSMLQLQSVSINIHVPWVWLHWIQSASTTINTEILTTSMLHVYDSLSTTVIILLILAMTSHTGYFVRSLQTVLQNYMTAALQNNNAVVSFCYCFV